MKVLQRVIQAQRTSDGAGVTLYRSLGQSQFARLDPFLMLDEFGSDRPDEYIAGFPDHPHRGFETITYMLEGTLRHRDNHPVKKPRCPFDHIKVTIRQGIETAGVNRTVFLHGRIPLSPDAGRFGKRNRPGGYSTVTLLARFRGLSTSHPNSTPMW